VNPLATRDANSARIVFRPFVPEVFFRGLTVCPQLQQANPVVAAFLELAQEAMKLETRLAEGL
jgi:hypothetical protein